MKRQGILVCGYYGFGNVGDEAVLAGLIDGLRQAGYASGITAMSAAPALTEREHGVASLLRTHLPAVWRALRQAQVFALGGGSLLQDTTSARSIVYYLGVHALARRAGCRLAWVGQGIGPLHRGWVRRWTAQAAREASAVVVRDPLSAQLLRQLGVPHVQQGADLSFLLPAAETTRGWQILQRLGIEQGERVVAFAPRRWGHESETLAETLRQLACEAQKRWGARVLLLPMQPSRDRGLVEEIAAGVPGAIVLSEPLRVQEVQAVLSCCHLVVGMRLHALMLSAASGVPALAISYDPKVRAFGEQVESEYVIDLPIVDVGMVQQRFCRLWEQSAVLRERVQAFAERQRSLAQQNIDALRQLMS